MTLSSSRDSAIRISSDDLLMGSKRNNINKDQPPKKRRKREKKENNLYYLVKKRLFQVSREISLPNQLTKLRKPWGERTNG